MKALKFALILLVFPGLSAYADFSYHTVGWLNTFLPGSGQILLGENLRGTIESVAEVGTFAVGYSLSPLSPMTIDGVPPTIPDYQFRRTLAARQDVAEFQKGIYAEWLQIVGIKLHMTDTFLAYRDAGAPNVDQSSLKDLFLAPFKADQLTNPWVYGAIAVSALAVTLDFISTVHAGVPKHVRLKTSSRNLYDVTALGIIPAESAAPEEMFYRGFLQNELLEATGSPYAAIPISSAAYAFSHKAGIAQVVAGITGLYLGFMTYRYDGALAPGIAFHFWSDVFVGIESIVLLSKGQPSRPITANLSLSW